MYGADNVASITHSSGILRWRRPSSTERCCSCSTSSSTSSQWWLEHWRNHPVASVPAENEMAKTTIRQQQQQQQQQVNSRSHFASVLGPNRNSKRSNKNKAMQRRCSTATSGTPPASEFRLGMAKSAFFKCQRFVLANFRCMIFGQAKISIDLQLLQTCVWLTYLLTSTYLHLPAPLLPVQLSCLCPVERGNAIFTHACAKPRQVQVQGGEGGATTRHVKWEYYSFYFSDRAAYVTGEVWRGRRGATTGRARWNNFA